MDIVREGLVMFFSVLDQAHRGDWPGVVRELVTSGEMRRTLVEALRIWKGGREPNADVLEEEPQRATHADDRRTEGTNSIAAGVQGNEVGPSVSQQPDQCAEAKVVRIGAPRRKRKHLVATPEILEALRLPLQDLTESATRLLGDKDSDEPPVDYRQQDEFNSRS